ncbi:MAG: hypothetical protein HKN91_14205 [Acidimicrobiia bacterium]|nr:hypothetical protein [Acidimicrobiia bacterium]
MSRALRLVVALLLVLAACGGGDDEGGNTTAAPAGDGSAAAPTTQAPNTPAVTVGNDFCGFIIEYANSSDFSPVGVAPAQVEAAFMTNLDVMQQAAAIAPGEISADVDMFVVAYGGFVDFLGDYDYNFLNIPEEAFDDPRLAAMEDPELDAAGERIEEFCGVDNFIATPPAGPAGGGGGTAAPLPGAELPADFPAELVPPDSVVLANISVGGGVAVTFQMEADPDDIIAFFTDVLGPPAQSINEPKGALWFSEYQGKTASVTVAEVTPGVVQANVTLG